MIAACKSGIGAEEGMWDVWLMSNCVRSPES